MARWLLPGILTQSRLPWKRFYVPRRARQQHAYLLWKMVLPAERKITLGIQTPNGRGYVVQGIEPGTQIVVVGQRSLKDGDAVTAEPAKNTKPAETSSHTQNDANNTNKFRYAKRNLHNNANKFRNNIGTVVENKQKRDRRAERMQALLNQ